MSKDIIKLYNKYIFTYEEKYLKIIKSNMQYTGHLINIQDYDNLKQITEYDKNKEHIYNQSNSSLLNQQKKLYPIKEIKLKIKVI